MPLTITAKGATPFTARSVPAPLPSGRFQGAHFFGAGLLEIANTGRKPILNVMVTITSTPPAEITLYGPTSNISIPAGGRIPIGVAFARNGTSATPTGPSGVVTVSYRDGLSPRLPTETTEIGVSFKVFPHDLGGQDTIFVPSEVELKGGGTLPNQSVAISLLVRRNGTMFAIDAFSPGSAYSKVLGWDPMTTTWAAGQTSIVALRFDPDPAKDWTPQAVTVTVDDTIAPQAVPLICWVPNTPWPGDVRVVVTPNPPGSDVDSEFATITSLRRAHDLGGCRLSDRDPGLPFPFPSPYILSSGSSVNVFSGRRNTSPGSKLFWGRTTPVWNNDSDTATFRNFLGEVVFTYNYTSSPTDRTGTSVAVAVLRSATEQTTGITLEDGDTVIFMPDPSSSIWTSNIFSGTCSPAGISAFAPMDGTWMLGGVPKFGLLADVHAQRVFIGNGGTITVNRDSALPPGPLSLMINDQLPVPSDAYGYFACVVILMR